MSILLSMHNIIKLSNCPVAHLAWISPLALFLNLHHTIIIRIQYIITTSINMRPPPHPGTQPIYLYAPTKRNRGTQLHTFNINNIGISFPHHPPTGPNYGNGISWNSISHPSPPPPPPLLSSTVLPCFWPSPPLRDEYGLLYPSLDASPAQTCPQDPRWPLAERLSPGRWHSLPLSVLLLADCGAGECCALKYRCSYS